MALEEQVLIKQILAGDKKASRSLYEQHERYWFRICLRYGTDKQEAEDLFQVGVVKIFQVLDRYDLGSKKFKAWSNKILINEALKYMRKYKQKMQLEPMNERMQVEDFKENAFSQLATKEIINMIQKLPAGYRLVFNLHQMEGYTHKQIAQELGISEGASKSQLFKARNMLKRKLEMIYK